MALSFASVSCAVQIKNAEWCGDMGAMGAHCFNTLSEEERELDKEAWDQERFGQVCTKVESFAEMKAALAKLCSRARCTFEEKQHIQIFYKQLNSFQTQLK